MKISKYLLFAVIVSMFFVSCAKPPAKEYDDAKAALSAAKGYNAEKCAVNEYKDANESLKSAELQMEEAKNHTFKGKYYDKAKAELEVVKSKAAGAEKVAKEKSAENDKVALKLEELSKEIDILKADSTKYASLEYSDLLKKYQKAKALVDDCKPEEAKALIAEIEKLLKTTKETIAAGKAEELRKALEQQVVKNENTKPSAQEYTVIKGDSLWKISDKKYVNPFMWPLIYWANKDAIKDPDLIFPGQIFKVKMDYNDSEKDDAVKFSKSRGPWSLFDGK